MYKCLQMWSVHWSVYIHSTEPLQLLFPHGTWGMQCNKSSWDMGCAMLHNTLYNPIIDGKLIVHGSWVVQQYACSITHGLCNGLSTPWPMDYITAWVTFIPHGPWVVQWYVYPMGYGLFNGNNDGLYKQVI